MCTQILSSILSKLWLFNGKGESTGSSVSVSRRWKEAAWGWNTWAVWSFAHPVIPTLWLLPVTTYITEAQAPFSLFAFHYLVYTVHGDSQLSSSTPAPASNLSLKLLWDGSSQSVAVRFGLSGIWHSGTDCSLSGCRPDITCSLRHPCVLVCALHAVHVISFHLVDRWQIKRVDVIQCSPIIKGSFKMWTLLL